jgi:hypothetical protein
VLTLTKITPHDFHVAGCGQLPATRLALGSHLELCAVQVEYFNAPPPAGSCIARRSHKYGDDPGKNEQSAEQQDQQPTTVPSFPCDGTNGSADARQCDPEDVIDHRCPESVVRRRRFGASVLRQPMAEMRKNRFVKL